MAGRVSKLTPEVQKRIIDALSLGATRKDAVNSVRIDNGTFCRWMEKGEKAQKGIYREFRESVLAAESEVLRKMTVVIVSAAAEGDWHAALTFLKRRDREHWGDNVDLTTDGEPIKAPKIVIEYVNDWRPKQDPE